MEPSSSKSKDKGEEELASKDQIEQTEPSKEAVEAATEPKLVDPRRVGPEDALDPNTKLDYSEVHGYPPSGPSPHTSVYVEHEDPFVRDDDGNVVDNKSHTEVVPQLPFAGQTSKD